MFQRKKEKRKRKDDYISEKEWEKRKEISAAQLENESTYIKTIRKFMDSNEGNLDVKPLKQEKEKETNTNSI